MQSPREEERRSPDGAERAVVPHAVIPEFEDGLCVPSI